MVYLLLGTSLESNLSGWINEKRNRILYPKDTGKHLLLYSPGLATMEYIEEIDGGVLTQI